MILIFAAFLQITGFFWITRSLHPHWVRAFLFTVVESSQREDFIWEPGRAPAWYRSDPVESYRDFKAEAEAAVAGTTEFEQDVALMVHTRSLGNEKRGDWISALSLSETRTQIQEGRPANCAHYSWLLMAFLRSIGREARVWGLDYSDGLGGNGHVVTEVWVVSLRKWVLLDPLNSAYFMKDGVPLSLFEIRDLLYAYRPDALEIHQGEFFETPKADLAEHYHLHVKDITLDGAGDLISRSRHPYGLFSWLAPSLAGSPRPVKVLLANLLGEKDLRVHFLDQHATPYEASRFRRLFQGIALLLLGSALNGLLWIFPRRGHRHETS